MVDIQSPTAEIRRGKKRRRKKIEITGQSKPSGLTYKTYEEETALLDLLENWF